MAFNGSGVFLRLYNWVNDAAANIKIRADRMDAEMDGMATGLSTCITKDGQTTITANLPMATYRHTGVGNAVNRTDYAAYGQVQDNSSRFVAAGGTADAITASLVPSVTSIPDGFEVCLRSTATNTVTNPTLSLNGLTARTIYKNGGSALVAGDIPIEAIYRYNLASTRWELLNPLYNKTNLSIVDTIVQDFRLTLTSVTPVTTSDVTGATTIYCAPYKGNKIALWNGTTWVNYSSAEFSIALGTITSGLPYDVFCYQNSGTPTLEILAWTNDSTRATALAYQNGVYIKSGDATRRYLGSFYTTSTTTTEDSITKRYLYNYYNRVPRYMLRQETTASWTYTTATIRQANASTSNQLNFLIGVSEDSVEAYLKTTAENSSVGVEVQSGIGLNATNSFSAGANTEDLTKVANSRAAFHSKYCGIPAAGRNYLSWNEYSAATGTTTWYGNSNRSLLAGVIRA